MDRLPSLPYGRPPNRFALCALAALALVLGLAACGGSETTVTVTETVAAKAPEPSGEKTAAVPQTEKGAVAGFVDNLKVEGDTLVLSGWAAAADLSKPATRVAALVKNEALAEAVPAVEREDVVEALGKPGLKESGFELDLPIESLECGTPAAGIKVVGTLAGKSSVIPFGEGINKAVTGAC
ncbi:MAG: hypothetical protein H0X42_11220 [Solirubrobacterales bacterium]|nr:hypothetical protein [Solirubrobacterales bacterium]